MKKRIIALISIVLCAAVMLPCFALADALTALDSPDIIWDTYYAYTCRKCAAAFAEFGMADAVREMEERAEIVHEHAGD